MRRRLLTLTALIMTIAILSDCFSKPTDTVTEVKNHLTKQIKQVAARYGEPNPTIVKAISTMTADS